MTNPFLHDVTSNAQTDFSFNDDEGVPAGHLVSFTQAMDAPNDPLSEEDYRYPGGRPGGDEPVTDGNAPADPVTPWQAPQQPMPGYYPRGYAP
jgi:hypothetical protein